MKYVTSLRYSPLSRNSSMIAVFIADRSGLMVALSTVTSSRVPRPTEDALRGTNPPVLSRKLLIRLPTRSILLITVVHENIHFGNHFKRAIDADVAFYAVHVDLNRARDSWSRNNFARELLGTISSRVFYTGPPVATQ